MIFIKKNIMDKLILEEIQRMNLLSKYDNSKTLSEQKVLTNPADKLNILPKATNPQTNAATGKPIVANPANQFNVLPKGTNQQANTATGKPMVTKPTNPADKFNVLPKGTNQQSNTATGKPMVYKQPTAADKINQTLKSVGQAPSAINQDGSKGKNTRPDSLGSIPNTSKGQGLIKNKPTTPTPLQLKDDNGIKTFQDWLDKNAPGWATGYKGGVIDQGKGGGGYGKFGPRTQKAWAQYKDKYLQTTSPQSITSKGVSELPVTPPQEPQAVKLQPQQQVTYTKRR